MFPTEVRKSYNNKAVVETGSALIVIFYKYVTAERIDILQNRLIRFTQPNALNDPFEARPNFHALTTKEGFAGAFADMIRKAPTVVWEDFRRVTQTNLDQRAFADKLEKDPHYAEQVHKNVGLSDPRTYARKRTYELCNVVGILSLSETPNNLLMWSHYAEDHTGFVLMLDSSHDFFKGETPLPRFAKPEPVQYKSERPCTTVEEVIVKKTTVSTIFLIKSSDWQYEKESRYLKFLNDADERHKSPNTPPVELFRLPPKCIKGVILGCRSSKELKDSIVALRRDDPEFEHLQIQQAGASTKHYRLGIKEVET